LGATVGPTVGTWRTSITSAARINACGFEQLTLNQRVVGSSPTQGMHSAAAFLDAAALFLLRTIVS
jgi:hypothetical protein